MCRSIVNGKDVGGDDAYDDGLTVVTTHDEEDGLVL